MPMVGEGSLIFFNHISSAVVYKNSVIVPLIYEGNNLASRNDKIIQLHFFIVKEQARLFPVYINKDVQ